MQQIKTVNIRGKNYVEVAERVRLVHDQQRKFEVVSSEPFQVGDRLLWRVVILVDEHKYTGNAEVKLNAPKNTPDGTNPFECAETSALGRALAFAGFGSVESIASLDEVYRAMSAQADHGPATPEQMSRIQKAYKLLGKSEQFEMSLSRAEANKLIDELTAEYREMKKAS